MPLASGARQLPLRHLSIRVPWHDARWNGTVCEHPLENASCLVLSRIRENRRDTEQEILAGKSFNELPQEKLPPCAIERVGFMAPYEEKLAAVQRTFNRVSQSDDPEVQRIIPVWAKNRENAQRVLDSISAERERRLSDLNAREQVSAEYQPLTASFVEIIPKLAEVADPNLLAT